MASSSDCATVTQTFKRFTWKVLSTPPEQADLVCPLSYFIGPRPPHQELILQGKEKEEDDFAHPELLGGFDYNPPAASLAPVLEIVGLQS